MLLLVMTYRLLAGVVRRQREAEVVGEECQEIAQIARADRKVDGRIEKLLLGRPYLVCDDTVTSAGIRSDLHEP